MAITLIKKPHTISPNGNLNTWMFSSDNPNLIYCVLTMTKAQSTDIIAKKKVFPKPLTNVLSVDVSNVLKNLAESVLNNSNEVITLSNLPAYNVTIEEYTIDPNTGDITAGAKMNVAGDNYFFESEENGIEFMTYTSSRHNLNTDNKAKFLTNQQSVKTITTAQKEFLKIFDTKKVGKYVRIGFYDEFYDLVRSMEIPISNTGNVININLNPELLFAVEDDMLLVKMYKVTVLDSSKADISEPRVYNLIESCEKRERNIIFKNSIGGWDSIIVNNSIETLTTTKTYINRNTNNTHTKDNKFYGNKDVINTNNTYSYTASSGYLDDYASNLAKEVITSNKVYIGVDDFMVEITVDNKTYKVLQQHVNGFKRNRLDLQYTAPFSIVKLQSVINAYDLEFNESPIPTNYLVVKNGDFVVDNIMSYITLKY